ncbi:glycogen debranching protein GlgX [Allonocardiopsis opalescens]|uniref:Glycogen operon protein n=1 Tax=Allonocardiopsis opalescens TaxID=1144618 RepID=A0A2T0PZZ9_9ACTN|nr:glycogen debranching protein GlgX [Allonocardiopsis opalescens]PRX97096.1 glycogen operon protein [Allonocardiopsis opalescens]
MTGTSKRESFRDVQVDPLPQRIDAYPTQTIAGFPVRPGQALPFGATPVPGGINFSVYSNGAERMTLVLFRPGEPRPLAELPFPPSFRTGGVYAMTVFGLDPESIEYGYRAYGPFEPEMGHRFDARWVLTDPYARLIAGHETWGRPSAPDDPYPYRARVPYGDFDWEEVVSPGHRHEDLVIYETHVRGFTAHPASETSAPGTFSALVEKIPYLKGLGVNCVELMPTYEFDELDNPRTDPTTGRRLYNYWGYNPLGFFAPKASYAATGRFGMQVDEFKNMVKELHRAGIEVVLDVVFNHTAEGNEQGPTISFRGLDNSTYYMLTPGGYYANFSGTGNTLNCNHPVVRQFVLDCLRYWVTEFRVDGFRFDLASILGRAPDGSVLPNPPLLETLAHDPVLRDCKLIAEAWDAAGLYQVGSFPAYDRWSEWNGRYRDTVRRFLKGDAGTVGDMATRLAGSSDLYGRRGPTASINFVTAHDGFTLRDLVSYNTKHNEANGEDNRDGDNANNSWNCGWEGPTDDPEVLRLRNRQSRNALLLLLTSRGVPMLLSGDEVGRTQDGNNNAYCQDGPQSWFDWRLTEENADLLRFTRCAIAFRAAHPALRPRSDRSAPVTDQLFPDVSWHGVHDWTPDWSADSRLLAAMFYAGLPSGAEVQHDCVYVAANSHWEGQRLELPRLPEELAWHTFADTAAEAPHDVYEPGREALRADQSRALVGPRSVLVLVARSRL